MKTAYFLVEGADDDRFVQKVIEPTLNASGCHVRRVQYANKDKELRVNLLRSIRSMQRQGRPVMLIVLADLDPDQFPCITKRKLSVLEKFPGLQPYELIIVVPEIEGWYLAGLPEQHRIDWKIPALPPDQITKERFDARMPSRFSSRVNYMVEILNHYGWDQAVQASASVAYLERQLRVQALWP